MSFRKWLREDCENLEEIKAEVLCMDGEIKEHKLDKAIAVYMIEKEIGREPLELLAALERAFEGGIKDARPENK